MNQVKLGVIGSGGIGLACAAWTVQRGHEVSIWSPRGGAEELSRQPLKATGALDAMLRVGYADSAHELVVGADVILIAVPVNGHKMVMDAILPHLRSGQMVIVSAMGSLSSLYLYEAAVSRGIDLHVASFGTTVLTARRKNLAEVNIMTRRGIVPVSCLPQSGLQNALVVCEELFGGGGFRGEETPLVSTLANTSPTAHVPLALFNWTRIERGENWAQYHYMTPSVSSVIEDLDAERMAVASSFGIRVPRIDEHFSRSFNVDGPKLSDIATELHRRRGGPPGPTDVGTRFLSEDVPFGLVFLRALGEIAQTPTPITENLIALSSLVVGANFAEGNDLVVPLGLPSESVHGLLRRVNAGNGNHQLGSKR